MTKRAKIGKPSKSSAADTARRRNGKLGGRPKAGTIPWGAIKRYAETGACEADVIEAYDLEKAVSDVDVRTKLRSIVERGNAYKRLLLLEAIDKRGKRTTKGAGSVNALALQARNLLDWDKQLSTQEPEPDLSNARARLTLTLEKLAKVKSAELGRLVTPEEILIDEAYTNNPKRGAEIKEILLGVKKDEVH